MSLLATSIITSKHALQILTSTYLFTRSISLSTHLNLCTSQQDYNINLPSQFPPQTETCHPPPQPPPINPPNSLTTPAPAAPNPPPATAPAATKPSTAPANAKPRTTNCTNATAPPSPRPGPKPPKTSRTLGNASGLMKRPDGTRRDGRGWMRKWGGRVFMGVGL